MVLLSIEIVFRQSRSEISEIDQLGDGESEGSDSEASGCTVASPFVTTLQLRKLVLGDLL